ncbi:MAG TPA: hypothetical protein VM096_12805 [Vicinamibacterales bacterium]|nr:hypothetical protein [Vicinamibacterales bacterium]
MRSPLPIAILASINAVIWFVSARKENAISVDLEAAWRAFEHHSRFVTGIALGSATVAAVFATRSAAGADASGYLSEAAMWADLWPFHVEWLAVMDFPGLEGWITTPLGWSPPTGVCAGCNGLQVPTYPPGLPLLMAIPHAIAGIDGAVAIVVLSTLIAVIATGLLASELGGRVAGVIAAVMLAFTPVFIHQSIQPMSDVPVTAAWTTCFLLARRQRSLWSGVACAIAVLIRPNLAPLAIVPLAIAEHRIVFAWPVAVAGLFLAAIQTIWYGSPLRSGYGSAEELFAIHNIAPNASRYFSWLLATAPLLFVSAFGFMRLRRDRMTHALFAFVGLVIGSYLVYAVFDDWSYLRFVRPAMAVLAAFAAVEFAAWIDRAPIGWRGPILFVLLLAVMAHGLVIARSHDTFKLADQLRRVSRVGDFINTNLPEFAVILSGEQSGSMRYYTRRSILRWEAATPEALTSAIATLEQNGRPVYVVLDGWENELFRKKFATVAAVSLDWPPMLEAGTSHRTRLWRLTDRDRFLRGEPLDIIRLPQ